MKRSLLVRLFFTIWLVYLFHFNPLASGSDRFVYLTMSIVERGTIDIDPYRDHTIELSAHDGHYYINTNPGLSFVAAPAWAIVEFFYCRAPATSAVRNEAIHFLLAHFVSFAVTTALFGALSAVLLAAFVYARAGQQWRALLAALVYAFGSIAFFFSTRAQQNVTVAFIGLLLFVLVFEPGILLVRPGPLQLAATGLVAGTGLFIDLSLLPFLIMMLVPVLQRARSARGFTLVLAGMAGPILALMLYQYRAFGNPFLPAQAYLVGIDQTVHAKGFLGATVPDLHRLLEHLVMPKAGLFVYMPFAALAVWYLIAFWSRDDVLPKCEKAAIAAGLLLYLLYASSVLSSRFTDYGPRYLLPVVPFLCLLFALYVRRKELQLATLLAGLAFVINIAGAQRGIDTDNVGFVLSLYALSGPWMPILNWVQSDLTRITGHSPTMVSPYGLILFMVSCLAAVWLPYFLRQREPSAADNGLHGALQIADGHASRGARSGETAVLSHPRSGFRNPR